ncbi:unnamed protein product [Amoebophrya sp. A120]|nr:unnamed protein product [Amoebophrya sp. A120]|eukprot:GSA120T00022666001.1
MASDSDVSDISLVSAGKEKDRGAKPSGKDHRRDRDRDRDNSKRDKDRKEQHHDKKRDRERERDRDRTAKRSKDRDKDEHRSRKDTKDRDRDRTKNNRSRSRPRKSRGEPEANGVKAPSKNEKASKEKDRDTKTSSGDKTHQPPKTITTANGGVVLKPNSSSKDNNKDQHGNKDSAASAVIANGTSNKEQMNKDHSSKDGAAPSAGAAPAPPPVERKASEDLAKTKSQTSSSGLNKAISGTIVATSGPAKTEKELKHIKKTESLRVEKEKSLNNPRDIDTRPKKRSRSRGKKSRERRERDEAAKRQRGQHKETSRDRGKEKSPRGRGGGPDNHHRSKGGSPRGNDRHHKSSYNKSPRGGGPSRNNDRGRGYRGDSRARGGRRHNSRSRQRAGSNYSDNHQHHLSRNKSGKAKQNSKDFDEPSSDLDIKDIEEEEHVEEENEEARLERLRKERLEKRAAIMAKHASTSGGDQSSAEKQDTRKELMIAPPSVDPLTGTPYGAMASPSAPTEDDEDSNEQENQPHLNDELNRELGATGMQELNEFIRLSKKEDEKQHDLEVEGGPKKNSPKQSTHEQAAADNMFGEIFDAGDTGHAKKLQNHGAGAEDWNNEEGYYIPKMGELIMDRYHVINDHVGKGVFSGVARCTDKATKREVAVKFIRDNAMMAKAAQKEILILKRLNKKDPDNRRSVIRLIETFVYRGHTCMVFEAMMCSLREGIKAFSKRDRGVSLGLAQQWTKQFMVGLRHIHRNGIIHADIKPDNLLVNDPNKQILLKICDLGSALDSHEVESNGYQVSRFYRAPEVIIEANWDAKIDIWSAACTVWECLTSKILFKGDTNNDQLKVIMDIKGKMSGKMIKSGRCWKKYFDEPGMDFVHVYMDRSTLRDTTKKVLSFPTNTASVFTDQLTAHLDAKTRNSRDPAAVKYMQMMKSAGDFMHQLTTLDPAKRPDADEALKHPFCQTSLSSSSRHHHGGGGQHHPSAGPGGHHHRR